MSNISVGQSAIGYGVVGNVASTAATAGATQATGSSFGVFVVYTSTLTLSSIGDNQGNSGNYLQVGTSLLIGGNANLAGFLCTNGSGGAGHVFTATFTTGPTCTICGVEILNGALTSLFDASAFNKNTANQIAPISTGNVTITPPSTGELLICAYMSEISPGPAVYSDASGFGFSTIQSQPLGNISQWTLLVEGVVKTANGTYNGDPSDGSGLGEQMGASIFGFKGPSTAGISLAWIT